jgi:hypothetical protein
MLSATSNTNILISRDPRVRAREGLSRQVGAEALPPPWAGLTPEEDDDSESSESDSKYSEWRRYLNVAPQRRNMAVRTSPPPSRSPSPSPPPLKRLRPADPADGHDNAPYHFDPDPFEPAPLPGQQASRPPSANSEMEPTEPLPSPPASPTPSVSGPLSPPLDRALRSHRAPAMLSLIQGAVERLRATHGASLGEFRDEKSQEGAQIARPTKILGLVVVALDGASINQSINQSLQNC